MDEYLDDAIVLLPGVLILAGLIVASAFFSGSETALFYLSRDELRSLQLGKPRKRRVAELLRDPDRLLTAVLFWNLITNLTYFAVSVVMARQMMARNERALAGLVSLGSLFAIILLGEVVPKSAAVVFHRRIAVIVGWPLAAAVRVLDPLLSVFGSIARMLRLAFWPDIRREPFLDAEDLERAVEASQLSEESIKHEQQVLHRILDLSEMTVEEVMRPRGTYLTRSIPVHQSHLMNAPPALDYLVLQDDEPDTVSAVVPLATLSVLPTKHLERLAEPVVHLPWCATLADCLQMLRDQLCNVAVVVNEYGETVGLVTYEDVMETVLLPAPSRAKRVLRREPVLEVAPGRYHVDGLTTLRYLSQRLGVDYEPTADGLLTVAGMLHEELERLPEVGDRCLWNGYEMKVIQTLQRGKLRVMVTREAQPQDEAP